MQVGEYCTRDVIVAERSAGIHEAARLMREHHVGDLVVVVDDSDGSRRPVGIVTDRDLVVEVMATDLVSASVTLADLPSRELAVAEADDDPMAVVQRMRSVGVRRMPVVDAEGTLAGIITQDDIIEVIGELTELLVKRMAREVAVEERQRT
jgi:CBS domain-containing protein